MEAKAKQYCEWDTNAETRAVVQGMLDRGDSAGLEKALGSRLEFGTAGLRGPMAAGYAAMNELVVVQTTQGLALYLEKVFGAADLAESGVAIGWDHRASGTLNSEKFGLLAAEVLLRRGIRVALLPGLVHTPLVSYAVAQCGCKAGIMVTASHNPREDDGYKVYWSSGAQIVPPHDSGIAGFIEQALAPWAKYGEPATPDALVAAHAATLVGGAPIVASRTAELAPKYFAQMKASLCRHEAENGSSDVKIVYTAMHGVGGPWFSRGFEAFGLPPPTPVAEQHAPDPTFPTVAFPNPEEGAGALELAYRTAEAAGATLVLANDPDADRLAVAERFEDGSWRVLTGNEIGVLFADWEITQYNARKAAGEACKPAAVLCSAVSSHMIAALAKSEGVHWEETLTGFKWLCTRSVALREEGYEVLVAYEEAIGFCVGGLVNDKDGVSAGAVFAEMAGYLRRTHNGRTVVGHLNELYARLGQFTQNNGYVICRNPKTTAAIFGRLRAGAYDKGGAVNGSAIVWVRDLTTGVDTDAADGKATLPLSSSSHMISYRLENGATFTLRGSGTEPKIKWYAEMVGTDRAATVTALQGLVDVVLEDMLQPKLNGLEMRK